MGLRHRIDELTREEVRSRAPEALAVVTIGACEQHGPHLPVGTDTIIVEHVALAAAENAAPGVDVLVAPAIPVGYSPHHTAIGPTLTSRIETLIAQLTDVCSSLADAGFRRVFILNGHGGNAEIVAVAARVAAQTTGIPVAAGSYWVMSSPALEAGDAQRNGRVPGHAGAFETSLMLALRPDLVVSAPARLADFRPNPPRYFSPYFVEDPGSWVGTDGFSDDPSQGTAEQGAAFLKAIVFSVTAHFVEFARG